MNKTVLFDIWQYFKQKINGTLNDDDAQLIFQVYYYYWLVVAVIALDFNRLINIIINSIIYVLYV